MLRLSLDPLHQLHVRAVPDETALKVAGAIREAVEAHVRLRAGFHRADVPRLGGGEFRATEGYDVAHAEASIAATTRCPCSHQGKAEQYWAQRGDFPGRTCTASPGCDRTCRCASASVP